MKRFRRYSSRLTEGVFDRATGVVSRLIREPRVKDKADWPEARRRLTALWRGERLDRLGIAVAAPRPVAAPTPVPVPVDDEREALP